MDAAQDRRLIREFLAEDAAYRSFSEDDQKAEFERWAEKRGLAKRLVFSDPFSSKALRMAFASVIMGILILSDRYEWQYGLAAVFVLNVVVSLVFRERRKLVPTAFIGTERYEWLISGNQKPEKRRRSYRLGFGGLFGTRGSAPVIFVCRL